MPQYTLNVAKVTGADTSLFTKGDSDAIVLAMEEHGFSEGGPVGVAAVERTDDMIGFGLIVRTTKVVHKTDPKTLAVSESEVPDEKRVACALFPKSGRLEVYDGGMADRATAAAFIDAGIALGTQSVAMDTDVVGVVKKLLSAQDSAVVSRAKVGKVVLNGIGAGVFESKLNDVEAVSAYLQEHRQTIKWVDVQWPAPGQGKITVRVETKGRVTFRCKGDVKQTVMADIRKALGLK